MMDWKFASIMGDGLEIFEGKVEEDVKWDVTYMQLGESYDYACKIVAKSYEFLNLISGQIGEMW